MSKQNLNSVYGMENHVKKITIKIQILLVISLIVQSVLYILACYFLLGGLDPGPRPTGGPSSKRFALQWNIGLTARKSSLSSSVPGGCACFATIVRSCHNQGHVTYHLKA